jgi:hypothetical protein
VAQGIGPRVQIPAQQKKIKKNQYSAIFLHISQCLENVKPSPKELRWHMSKELNKNVNP